MYDTRSFFFNFLDNKKNYFDSHVFVLFLFCFFFFVDAQFIVLIQNELEFRQLVLCPMNYLEYICWLENSTDNPVLVLRMSAFWQICHLVTKQALSSIEQRLSASDAWIDPPLVCLPGERQLADSLLITFTP